MDDDEIGPHSTLNAELDDVQCAVFGARAAQRKSEKTNLEKAAE